MSEALGIDFGGTSVKMGRISSAGRIEASWSFDTARADTPERWISAVAEGIAKLGWNASAWPAGFRGIGVGAPGFVDYARGHIYSLANVAGWEGVNLAERMEQRFGVPVRVDNDANAMAAGECAFGAGCTYRHAVFITLGTGVGGALWLDGRLYRGAHSMAGEIGHMCIDRWGPTSPEGRGGLELYVGNRPFVQRAREVLCGGRASRLRDPADPEAAALTPRAIAEAARSGDALAVELFEDLADALAVALASVTYLLQPEAFIVGGGVAQAGDVLFKPLRLRLKERLSPHFLERLEIRPALLGAEAGIIGAASLVMTAS